MLLSVFVYTLVVIGFCVVYLVVLYPIGYGVAYGLGKLIFKQKTAGPDYKKMTRWKRFRVCARFLWKGIAEGIAAPATSVRYGSQVWYPPFTYRENVHP